MADRDQEGLPLAEALRAFADPDKWRGYEQAAGAAKGKVRTRLMYLGGEPIAGWGAAEQARYNNHLLDRRDQAWRALQQAFLARLRSGELIATGYEEPLSLGRERKPVPAELWRALRPNFKNSTATGPGLKLFGLLVRKVGNASAPAGQSDPEPTFEVRPPLAHARRPPLGGMGSIGGTLIAALILGVAESFVATFYGPSWAPAVAFGILLGTLALRPQGIFGRY